MAFKVITKPIAYVDLDEVSDTLFNDYPLFGFTVIQCILTQLGQMFIAIKLKYPSTTPYGVECKKMHRYYKHLTL